MHGTKDWFPLIPRAERELQKVDEDAVKTIPGKYTDVNAHRSLVPTQHHESRRYDLAVGRIIP